MTFQNPLAFVKRKQFDLIIDGQTLVANAIDLEELEDLGDRFPWFGKQMRGEKVDIDTVPKSEMLKVASCVVAASLAPDTVGEQRRAVEASARNIDPGERAQLMREVLITSFPNLAEALSDESVASAEGNVPAPNRLQRRAARSNAGGEKPQT